jgi:hypothetical protein
MAFTEVDVVVRAAMRVPLVTHGGNTIGHHVIIGERPTKQGFRSTYRHAKTCADNWNVSQMVSD